MKKSTWMFSLLAVVIGYLVIFAGLHLFKPVFKNWKAKIPTAIEQVAQKKEPVDVFKSEFNWGYYLKNVDLDEVRNSSYKVIVIDTQNSKKEFSKGDIQAVKDTEKGVVAYVSLGNAEKYRPYWKEEWNKKKPKWMSSSENSVWKENYRVVDIMSKEWTDISKSLLNQVLEAGYDGIVIDGVVGKNANLYIQRVSEYLKSRDKNFKVFVQDYFDDEIIPHVDGVLKQGLFYDLYGKKRKDTKQVIAQLKKFKNADKFVLVVEFSLKPELWASVSEDIKKEGFIGYMGPVQLHKLGASE